MEGKSPYDYDDPRPQPEYDMVFRQAVGAEDVFLGMGGKNPTTASCEELVVREMWFINTHRHLFTVIFPVHQIKIKLPGISINDVDLDVTETFLDCRTKQQ